MNQHHNNNKLIFSSYNQKKCLVDSEMNVHIEYFNPIYFYFLPSYSTNTMARGIDPNTGDLVQTDKLARPFDQFEIKINAWRRATESVAEILQMDKM
jgi:hypothetical protein